MCYFQAKPLVYLVQRREDNVRQYMVSVQYGDIKLIIVRANSNARNRLAACIRATGAIVTRWVAHKCTKFLPWAILQSTSWRSRASSRNVRRACSTQACRRAKIPWHALNLNGLFICTTTIRFGILIVCRILRQGMESVITSIVK